MALHLGLEKASILAWRGQDSIRFRNAKDHNLIFHPIALELVETESFVEDILVEVVKSWKIRYDFYCIPSKVMIHTMFQPTTIGQMLRLVRQDIESLAKDYPQESHALSNLLLENLLYSSKESMWYPTWAL
jgi:hypothetical protein